MPRRIVICESCHTERPHFGRGRCGPCYKYLRRRGVDMTDSPEPDAASGPSLTECIEQEIARGTPTRDIMTQLDVDYSVVKHVRDAMDEAAAS